MRDFNDFRADLVKLIEYAMSKELTLDVYVETDADADLACEITERQNLCGTPACLLGYAPEVFPDLFEYYIPTEYSRAFIAIRAKKAPELAYWGTNCIAVFTGETCNILGQFFCCNHSNEDDYEVANTRLQILKEAQGYTNLKLLIDKKSIYFGG